MKLEDIVVRLNQINDELGDVVISGAVDNEERMNWARNDIAELIGEVSRMEVPEPEEEQPMHPAVPELVKGVEIMARAIQLAREAGWQAGYQEGRRSKR